jgi:hypothetical protein
MPKDIDFGQRRVLTYDDVSIIYCTFAPQLVSDTMFNRVGNNRESGVNPEQTRYCKFCKTLRQSNRHCPDDTRDGKAAGSENKSGDLPMQLILKLSGIRL